MRTKKKKQSREIWKFPIIPLSLLVPQQNPFLKKKKKKTFHVSTYCEALSSRRNCAGQLICNQNPPLLTTHCSSQGSCRPVGKKAVVLELISSRCCEGCVESCGQLVKMLRGGRPNEYSQIRTCICTEINTHLSTFLTDLHLSIHLTGRYALLD